MSRLPVPSTRDPEQHFGWTRTTRAQRRPSWKERSPERRYDARVVAGVDFKLEAVIIPVSDVDRAKEFYAGLGWRLDADGAFDNGFRVVQLTPPGSGCSVQFGTKVTSAAPGSAQGNYLIVSDVEAA